jgi:hypothetical protein
MMIVMSAVAVVGLGLGAIVLLVGYAVLKFWAQARYEEAMVEKAYGIDMKDPYKMKGQRLDDEGDLDHEG